MVVGMSEELVNFVAIMDRTGRVVHEIQPDWFELPTEDIDLPETRRPKSPPGTSIHGVAVMPNGDFVLNFQNLSTMRLDPCGRPVWMLPNFGHHFVEPDDDGNLWVSSERLGADGEDGANYANHEGRIFDWLIQKISPDGKLLRSIPVIDILFKNDLLGLLYLSTLDGDGTSVSGDTLHLNDVEVFPRRLSEGVFKHGDLMISLRNINTVIVVDPETLAIRYRITGPFLRQHDPDFVSGDRFIVFDNRNLMPDPAPLEKRSRILEVDAKTGKVREVFKPKGDAAFFTNIMGKQQLLPNGNLLITASWEGRAMGRSDRHRPSGRSCP